MSEENGLTFDLEVREVPVKIGAKDYVLREATEAVALKYRNTQMKSARMGPDGKPAGVDGLVECEPILVAGCLFERYTTPKGEQERPLTVPQVLAWPARVVTALHERAAELSGLENKPTLESLRKQRAELDSRIAKMEADASPPGGNPGAGDRAGEPAPDMWDDSPKARPAATGTTSS